MTEFIVIRLRFCWVKLDLTLVMSEQLTPEENSPQDNCPLNNCPLECYPPNYCSPDNCPRGKIPPDDCPRGYISWEKLPSPPGWLPPDHCSFENYPKDNFLLTISPWKLPPMEIVFWMICCLHNSPSDKWSRGKLPSRKITPKINYTRYIFSPRIINITTLINSCLLLFSFFVV